MRRTGGMAWCLDCYAASWHRACRCTVVLMQDLASEYLETAAANNITHVEIFFDPQGHADR